MRLRTLLLAALFLIAPTQTIVQAERQPSAAARSCRSSVFPVGVQARPKVFGRR